MIHATFELPYKLFCRSFYAGIVNKIYNIYSITVTNTTATTTTTSLSVLLLLPQYHRYQTITKIKNSQAIKTTTDTANITIVILR